MKSVRVLVLGSRDSTLIHVLRTLAKSTKYDYTLFGYGSENDFIQKSFNTKLLKNPSTETELIPFLIDSCEKNEIDFIIPTSTEFVAPLCENLEDFRTKNVEPIVPLSDPSLLEIIFHRPTLGMSSPSQHLIMGSLRTRARFTKQLKA